MSLVRLLQVNTGFTHSEIQDLVYKGPVLYKNFRIPKKSGGFRDISQPTAALKFVQRAIIDQFLLKLPVHECAKAYRRGMNIRDNALPHSGHGPIMKMDFKDFFPSIFAEDWIRYCKENTVFDDDEDIHASVRLMFMRRKSGTRLRLSVGAPTSPYLSNILLFRFDEILSRELAGQKIVYTRYADDLTFSAPRTGYLNSVENVVNHALKELESPKLRLNTEKTKKITTKFRRSVTGLTLSNEGSVSIGRKKKRHIRACVKWYVDGKLDAQRIEELHGYLAFIKSVDMPFYAKLSEFYGDAVISKLMATMPKRRKRNYRLKE